MLAVIMEKYLETEEHERSRLEHEVHDAEEQLERRKANLEFDMAKEKLETGNMFMSAVYRNLKKQRYNVKTPAVDE